MMRSISLSACHISSIKSLRHVLASSAVRPRPGHLGHQCSHAPGRPILHRRLILSQTSAGRSLSYIIDSSSFHGCSFVRAWRPFLRPGLRVQTGRAQGVVKAGRRAGLPLASMLPGHALTEAQQVLHARCNWPLRSALPVTPDDSVDKKRSKHYRRRFVSLACQNEPAAPPRSYLLLEIARVVGLPVGPARARPPHSGTTTRAG